MIQDRRQPNQDEVSTALGDRRYIRNYYPPGLKQQVLGPYSLGNVGVTRFYKWLDPAVVVDFEPSPLDDKFYVEEKRKFFGDQNIIYVPVYLKERLTTEVFLARVRDEHATMKLGSRVAKEDAALASIPFDDWMSDPEQQRWIDQEALRAVDARPTHPRGMARQHAVRAEKLRLIDALRKQDRDGRLGRDRSHRELAVPAGG